LIAQLFRDQLPSLGKYRLVNKSIPPKLEIVDGSGLQIRRGMMTGKKKEKFLVNGISHGIEMAWGKVRMKHFPV